MNQRFDDFVTGITVCYKYIQRIKSVAVNEMGLKGSYVMCMFYLKNHPEGLTAAQLCSLCAEDKAAISRTVSFLRKEGYIYSPGEKSYRAELVLTEAGRELTDRFDAIITDWVSAGGSGLSEQERRDFYFGLNQIAGNLREKMELDSQFQSHLTSSERNI